MFMAIIISCIIREYLRYDDEVGISENIQLMLTTHSTVNHHHKIFQMRIFMMSIFPDVIWWENIMMAGKMVPSLVFDASCFMKTLIFHTTFYFLYALHDFFFISNYFFGFLTCLVFLHNFFVFFDLSYPPK